ncbi:MAG: sensor domain-containing diguanylate cyclase [Lysobacter sp.]
MTLTVLVAAMALSLSAFAAASAPAIVRTAISADTPAVAVARLDSDPVPARIIAGEFDDRFVTQPNAVIRETEQSPRWWRVTVGREMAPELRPQLVVQAPYLTLVEVWAPGKALPIRRAMIGRDADLAFSTRALVVPMVAGLAAGDAIYLRVHALGAVPMPVSIEPLARVHRADLVHVAWRTAILVSLALLALLALGFWWGIGERSYGYLLLTLFAQGAFFAISGGEVRMLPGLAEIAGGDLRIVRLFGLVAALSSLVFLIHYLDLRVRQPRLTRVLVGCGAVLMLLALATLAGSANWIAIVANATLLLGMGAVLWAAVRGSLQRQRSAYFVLLSWLPMLALLFVRIGELYGLWLAPAWVGHAFPASFVLSGLVIMIGLSDSLLQLRRDRDRVSRLARFDALTGAMSRPALEARLESCVAEAHERGLALSLVFFDVDRFKRINDDYGHQVGDSCLKIVVMRTRNRLRTYDMIGRWGGDELVVVLPDTRLGEALGVAENLRSAINCRPLSIDGNLFEASISLGVAELAAGETAEHLLERADAALYSSKSAGRDRVTGHDSRVTGSQVRFATPK